MLSVIVPAHNEASVIERCLRSLTAGAGRAELEVIVVCNGCTDETAGIARRCGEAVRVIETPIPSKAQALNLGDAAARFFPRFYIDADVEVTFDAIRRVAEVLRGGKILAAAPRMQVKLRSCGWCVRAYYAIWTRLPYCGDGMIGSGFYALSQEGWERLGQFPEIISDDGYVRLLFKPEERASIEGCHFEITAPNRFLDLLKIKTRSQFGKYQLAATFPELLRNDPRRYRGSLRGILKQVRLWPCTVVYCFVLCYARLASAWRFLRGRHAVWDRDESSRQ